MKDLGMDPSRNSTHYLITMTTFTHHSLAETWNFVASVTGTQVFSCATNFKLFVKSTVKEEKEKHVPQHSLHRGSCVGTKLPFCLPLQSSVPPHREGLTFRALSFLQCCSHRGSSARKAISCKNSGQRRNKTKTSTCAQPYSPGPWFPSKLWPTKWRRLGTMLRKAPFPKENLLSPFQSVQPPRAPVIPHSPTVGGCTAPPACPWNWKKTAQGRCSHLCRALNNQDQVMSGITRVMGSSRLRTISRNEHPSAVPGWTITAGTGLSLPAAEHRMCWDCQRKILCSILSFKLIFTCSIIHLEQNLPIQTRPIKSFRFFRQKAKRRSKKRQRSKELTASLCGLI